MPTLTNYFIISVLLLLITPCRADLVAHWKLDEASGILASELINNHDGSIVGAAEWNTLTLPPVPSGTSAAIELDLSLIHI